jgi:hypothetical protein
VGFGATRRFGIAGARDRTGKQIGVTTVKTAAFGIREYGGHFLDKANGKLKLELIYHAESLYRDTAIMAAARPAVCAFVGYLNREDARQTFKHASPHLALGEWDRRAAAKSIGRMMRVDGCRSARNFKVQTGDDQNERT